MSHFEVHRYDAAGRLGELEVPRSGTTVRTPALMPVVNPHVQTLPPADMAETFGVEILITNAYVLHGSDELREPALERGLHDLLDFDGAIVTDSGSFQLAEYGDIDVTTEEIVGFQHEIGSDVGTPVDVPTPPDVTRERAEEELATTRERIETAAAMDTGEMLLNAPIQGSTYPDLRETAGEHAGESGCAVFPVGAVVPLLEDYRFAALVDVVAAAKRGLPESAPVHCFGAGHPMMLALAVALGCDLFDSAAYALYARDERYLTVRGTEHLADLHTFPCECPVCVAHDPDELREMADDEAQRLLARHNLHVTVGELRRIRAAIRDGSLLELVDQRARSHPSMCDGYRALLDHGDALERSDPSSKGTFFHVSTESARRPEIRRHQARLDRFDVSGDVLLTEDRGRGDGRDGTGDGGETDADARDGSATDADAGDDGATDAETGDYDEVWDVTPPFGPAPPELVRTYPLTAEVPDRLEPQAYVAAADGVARFVATQDVEHVTLAHYDWPEVALAVVPDGVRTVSLHDE